MKDSIFYNAPAKVWTDALPVGNGSCGAMIYGDPLRETVALNCDTLWSGTGRDKNNHGAAEYLSDIRGLMESGDIPGAEDIINKHTLGEMCETYMPFGTLYIDTPGADVTEYRRTLCFDCAVFNMSCRINGKSYSEEVFASYPDKLIIIKLLSEEKRDFTLTLDSLLKHETRCDRGAYIISGIAPESALPTVRGVTPPVIYGDAETSDAIRFYGAVEIISDGEISISDKAYIKGATYAELRLSLATSFISPFEKPKADARMRVFEKLCKARGKTYEEIKDAHIRNFSSLYGGFHISLGDGKRDGLPTDERLKAVCAGEDDPAFVSLLVMYGRYLLISSSRRGSRPANLQGVWNDLLHPAWCSNYTLNINTEMNYWGAERTGLSECIYPLFDFISELAENGRKTALYHYGCRGWVCHSSSDVWAYTASCGPVNDRRGCSRYAVWQGAGGWLCRHLYDRYMYGGDKTFLSYAFPVMLGAARFYLDFMYKGEDGKLRASPSLSPENEYMLPGGEKASADIMPAMDIEIIKELFYNCIKSSETLGEAPEIINEIKEALPFLPELKLNSDGSLCEWSREYGETEPRHRHVSHLYGLYPSDEFYMDEKLTHAAGRTLLKRGNDGTGWCIIWKCCLWARLGSSSEAYKTLKNMFRNASSSEASVNGLYNNLFDSCPPFQIDGNLGLVAAVTEMLCRDTHGKTEFLCACPAEWNEGEVKGLRLHGGRTVDFKWKDGKISEIKYR